MYFLSVCATDFQRAYDSGETTSNFIEDLNLFLCTFFKAHLRLLEKPEHQKINLDGHRFIVGIARVDEVEVFKVSLEYFYFLVRRFSSL